MSFFEQSKYFKRSENWGEPDKIAESLLQSLESYRAFTGERIYISYGTQGKHSLGSQHYPQNNPDKKGHAVDIVFNYAPVCKLPDLFIAALRFGFTGIGVYPYWNYNGVRHGGLHLEDAGTGKRELWLAILDERGDQKYIELTFASLIKHCL